MDYIVTYVIGMLGFAIALMVFIDLGVLPALAVGAVAIFILSRHIKDSIIRLSN